MAARGKPDPSHVAVLKQSVEAWNRWRAEHDPPWDGDSRRLSRLEPQLDGMSAEFLKEFDFSRMVATSIPHPGEMSELFSDHSVRRLSEEQVRDGWKNLNGINFTFTSLRTSDLSGISLSGADLFMADLSHGTLTHTSFSGARLRHAVLRDADLRWAKFNSADLSDADLRGANLEGASLNGAQLVRTRLEGANLSGCHVYGVAAWDVLLDGAIQRDLNITSNGSSITVDNLEIAQFLYLLLNNSRIRGVLDSVTSKAVLILGRFTPKRKATLDAVRDALRHLNYVPIVFDFEKPDNRDLTETVSTLAHLSRFVIADLTDPRSIPQELTSIIPRLLSVPICPTLLGSQAEWAMFRDLARYPQVISPLHYIEDSQLISSLRTEIIAPAEAKVAELRSL